MPLLLLLNVAAIPIDLASAQESASKSVTPIDPPTRRAKMDPRHPFHIGADYYPAQSRQNGEQGRCILNVYSNVDGSVPATQLLLSTGFPRLDIACLESVIGVPVLPAKENGVPVAGWSEFKIIWRVGNAPHTQYPPLEKPAVPRVVEDYEIQAGDKHYPDTAPAKQKGYCLVRATVGSTGTVVNATLTRSTVSKPLDDACLAAVKDTRFTPEIQDGQAVADATLIAIYW